MKRILNQDWEILLAKEFSQPYFKALWQFVENSYESAVCYPPEATIFAAFNHCSFEDLKVVIIGQDPYHGPRQANGLCFSVQDTVPIPPSLKNIYKELSADLGTEMPTSGNLEHWAKQGILLLNATLTVAAGKAGSHQKQGWETFTDNVISLINSKKKDVVFLLWGSYARKKSKLVDKNRHHILESGHPSPLSANRGYWFGNNHFSKTTEIIQQQSKTEFQWVLKENG